MRSFEDPGLTPDSPPDSDPRGLAARTSLVQPEPVSRTGPMMPRDTLWGRPGPAAPTVSRTATGRRRTLTSPEFGSPLERSGSWLPGLGGTAAPVGPWPRSGVRQSKK